MTWILEQPASAAARRAAALSGASGGCPCWIPRLLSAHWRRDLGFDN